MGGACQDGTCRNETDREIPLLLFLIGRDSNPVSRTYTQTAMLKDFESCISLDISFYCVGFWHTN